MIIGNGIDIIEIKRIEAALKRRPQLLFRVFTDAERVFFKSRQNSPRTIAGCFAAKEAAVKAVGSGFIKDVHLSWTKNGQPKLTFLGKEDIEFYVSISHSKDYAVASVIAWRGECEIS